MTTAIDNGQAFDQAAAEAASCCMYNMVEDETIRVATIVLDSGRTVVRVSRSRKPRKTDSSLSFVVTVGEPNYETREFIRQRLKKLSNGVEGVKSRAEVLDNTLWLKRYNTKKD